MVRIRAPEIAQDFPWLNVEQPLSLKALRGQVVLLDFWTYGCINCLHVISDLHYLEQKYSHHLTIIGVHTAKFDHEQELDGIDQAISRYGITHPVVVDRDRTLWDHYAIRAYPTFVVIDPQGYIVTTTSGEGQRHTLDNLIQQLIEDHEGKGTLNGSSVQSILKPPTRLNSPLAFPGKVIADEQSNTLFIADTGHHRIVITTLAGALKAVIGTGEAGSQDGCWETAQFSAPQGMAFDRSQQTLYVADSGNHLLRQIDLSRQEVNTLAGTGIQSRSLFPHGGKALEVELNSPWDLVKLGEELYVSMAGSHQLWRMDLTNQTIQTFVGTGAEYCVDGTQEIAAFAQPNGITTDGDNLFIADSETSSIRVVTLGETPIVHTLCGRCQLFEFGDFDGVGFEVQLQHCSGLVYANGYLWIADTYNHKIKQIHPVTGACRSLVGQETSGFSDGIGADVRFSEPTGVTYAGHHLYVADINNHAIRCINLESLEVTTLPLLNLCSPYACVPER